MSVTDFESFKARRDEALAASLAYLEAIRSWKQPYASWDDLPDVTPWGAKLIGRYISCEKS
jgi:hypothetical protein